jgi:metal-dependent amidase/aminoacylase/carboxypeptidase family protein
MSARSVMMSEEELAAVYRDLHAHPELAFQETRTAAVAAQRLAGWGYQVSTGVGGTGVVGILDNGPGASSWGRCDRDR